MLSEVKLMKSKLEEWEYLDDEDNINDLETCEKGDHTHYQRESYHAAKSIRKAVKDVEQKEHKKFEGEHGKS